MDNIVTDAWYQEDGSTVVLMDGIMYYNVHPEVYFWQYLQEYLNDGNIIRPHEPPEREDDG